MARFIVSFNMIRYSEGGGKNTALKSVSVTAESEFMARELATRKAITDSNYRGYECHFAGIQQLKG